MKSINILEEPAKAKPRLLAFSYTFAGLILLTAPAALLRWDGRVGVPYAQEWLQGSELRKINPYLARGLRICSSLGAIASLGLGAAKWHKQLQDSGIEMATALARNDIYGTVIEAQVRDITKDFYEAEAEQQRKKLIPNVRGFDPRLLRDYTLYPHIRVVGETRAGKTHLTQRLLKWCDSQKVIITPKVNPLRNDWQGYNVKGAGHNYKEIRQCLDELLEEMRRRQQDYKIPYAIDVVIDDATVVSERTPNFADTIKELILLAADVQIRLWLIVHLESMAALNLREGEAGMLENLKDIRVGKFAHKEINRLVKRASDGEEARYYQARKEWIKAQPRAYLVVDQPMAPDIIDIPPQLLKEEPQAPQKIYDSDDAEPPYRWVDVAVEKENPPEETTQELPEEKDMEILNCKDSTAKGGNWLGEQIRLLAGEIDTDPLTVMQAVERLLHELKANPKNSEFKGLKTEVLTKILGLKGRSYTKRGSVIWKALLSICNQYIGQSN